MTIYHVPWSLHNCQLLIHLVVQQKLTQLCKAIILQKKKKRYHLVSFRENLGLPSGLVDKESSFRALDARDTGLIPGLARSPGGEHGNPLQHSCLENSVDRGVWWDTKCRKELETTKATEHLHTHTHTHTRKNLIQTTLFPNFRFLFT